MREVQAMNKPAQIFTEYCILQTQILFKFRKYLRGPALRYIQYLGIQFLAFSYPS
jgi:hypothetical protein